MYIHLSMFELQKTLVSLQHHLTPSDNSCCLVIPHTAPQSWCRKGSLTPTYCRIPWLTSSLSEVQHAPMWDVTQCGSSQWLTPFVLIASFIVPYFKAECVISTWRGSPTSRLLQMHKKSSFFLSECGEQNQYTVCIADHIFDGVLVWEMSPDHIYMINSTSN